MESTSSVTIKATWGQDTRRISLPQQELTFEMLHTQLTHRFGISNRSVILKWIDEDGDAITIANQSDLNEALTSSVAEVLRIQLFVTETGVAQEAGQDVIGSLRSLSASLQLPTIPEPMLDHIAGKIKDFAPFVREMMVAHQERFENAGSCGSMNEPVVKHWGVTCDVSNQCPIVGVRFNKRGSDYDLCEAEFNKLSPEEQNLFDRMDKPAHRCPHRRIVKHLFQGGAPAAFKAAKLFCRFPNHIPVGTELSKEGDLLPDTPLAFGSSGPGVEQLQHALIRLNLLQADAIRHRSGLFGRRTASAVADLQIAQGVEVNGQYDDAIRSHLLKLMKESSASPVSMNHAANSTAVLAEEEESMLAEKIVQADEVSEKAATLMAMGFTAEEVARALEATQGSIERAADWLFENCHDFVEVMVEQAPPVPKLPEAIFLLEWETIAADLKDMGFDGAAAREILIKVNGNFKEAVRALVSAERNPA